MKTLVKLLMIASLASCSLFKPVTPPGPVFTIEQFDCILANANQDPLTIIEYCNIPQSMLNAVEDVLNIYSARRAQYAKEHCGK